MHTGSIRENVKEQLSGLEPDFCTLTSKQSFNSDSLKRSSRELFLDIAEKKYMSLMHVVKDDNYNSEIKDNTAFCIEGRDDVGENWSRLNFDSPLNSFPEEYYLKTSSISEVCFAASLECEEWILSILRRTDNHSPTLVSMIQGRGRADVYEFVKLHGFASRLSIEIRYKGNIVIDRAGWFAEVASEVQPLCVSVTTYNKQDYLFRNCERMLSSLANKNGLLKLLIVNNGQKIPPLDESVKIIELPNVGGAGGFVTAYNHYSELGSDSFLVMDDDIEIQDDLIDRYLAISNFCKTNHVGALAEVLNTPERIVKEQGGRVSANNVFGLNLHNHLINISGQDSHRIYAYTEHEFSGWWSLLVKIKKEKLNLPASLFIKRDDIMFGHESYHNGISTVVFPNLHVAHSEEGSSTYYYFDIRNDLILRARSEFLGISALQIFKVAGSLVFSLSADKHTMFNLALKDFLLGPKGIDQIDLPSKLKELRKIALKPQELPEGTPVISSTKNFSLKLALIGYLNPKLYRSSGQPSLLAKSKYAHASHVSEYYEEIPFTGKVYRRKRSLSSLALTVNSVFLIAKLYAKRGKLKKDYRNAR